MENVHDLTNAKVLVTGGAGMMGRPLVRKLLALGCEVRVADRQPRNTIGDMGGAIDYWNVDMLTGDSIIGLTEGMEYIFHLAGGKGASGIGKSNASDFMRVNSGTIQNLFKEIRKSHNTLHRLLFVSTVGAYPGNQHVFRESRAWDGPPHPSDYFGGWGKRFGEIMCQADRYQFGTDFIIVRPTSTFGPWDRFDTVTGMVIPALMARLEAGEDPLVLRGDRSTMRDFLYADDCAEGMIAAMTRGICGDDIAKGESIYNLGTGKPISISHVAHFLAKHVGREVRFEEATDPSPQIRSMQMEKAESHLGFRAKTRIEDALRYTFDWYREHKNFHKYDPFR